VSLPLPFHTLEERRPARDQRVKVRARDHLGEYELPFACKLIGYAWFHATSGKRIEIEIVSWRPLHVIDNHTVARPGRLTLHDVRGNQVF
jgi:hypothetical protein